MFRFVMFTGAAFVIGALNCLDNALNQPQVIIVAPTRELAAQIHKVQEHQDSLTNIPRLLMVLVNIWTTLLHRWLLEELQCLGL